MNAMTSFPNPTPYVNKRGRPRKANVKRDAAGKSRGEIPDFSVVLNQPHRRHAKDGKSELLGYPLGRLRLMEGISELQHRAGNEWAMLVRAYAGVIGIPFGSPRSGSSLNDSAKPGYAFAQDDHHNDPEEQERRIGALRSRYDGCFEALETVGHTHGKGRQLLIVARRACIEEQYPADHELGDLRLALNSLAKELGIDRP